LTRADNGHSGTNFERPAVQELLELVRLGKINCIAVKDFSRFGRNAIDMGYYIERVFPLYRVRFIALSESFDSDEHPGDTGGLDVSFHFLKNEWYSRDLSQKIKSAKREKIRRGEYVTKNCVFGYRLNEFREYEIDEPAAGTVRLIFQMYADGKSIADIQHKLYDDSRPTPYEHKRKTAAPRCIWGNPQLLKMLADEQYIGTYVAGKTESAEVSGKRIVRIDKANWTKIPNRHPAIGETAVFEAVAQRRSIKQSPLRKRKPRANKRCRDIGSPLKGKVVCGCCGHNMGLSAKHSATFHCRYTRAAPGEPCHGLKVLAPELEKAVFEIVSKQAKVILGTNSISDVRAIDVRTERQADYTRQIESLNDDKRGLYEKLILGELSAAGYKTEKAALDAELARLNASFSARSAEMERLSAAQSVKGKHKLSKPLADALIDELRIFPGNRIEIKWKISGFGETAALLKG
jgi:DNA invertase Pin-like site-specific DNA recombinase